MSRASVAYSALAMAMENAQPKCKDNAKFTADELRQPDVDELALICSTCPLFDLCSTYASIERPKIGVWAGKRYRSYKTTEDQS